MESQSRDVQTYRGCGGGHQSKSPGRAWPLFLKPRTSDIRTEPFLQWPYTLTFLVWGRISSSVCGWEHRLTVRYLTLACAGDRALASYSTSHGFGGLYSKMWAITEPILQDVLGTWWENTSRELWILHSTWVVVHKSKMLLLIHTLGIPNPNVQNAPKSKTSWVLSTDTM